MSKIKLTGDSSGYVELSAANNAGNKTLELPTDGDKILSNNNVGIVTATTFSGNLDGTSSLAQGLTGTPNITVGNINATGTITYDDVTNIDSVGVITARSGIDVTGGVITSDDYTITGISSSITDTAVDIFIYDTSKDSDGGAWRKRTKHTSWYNETLNTATRGSRREFPAVAVIVVETGQVTIYDGDDPDLPMWMVFNGTAGGASHNLLVNSGTFCLSALNGIVFMGALGIYVNFISEYSRGHRNTGGSLYWNGPYNGNIAERNAGRGSTRLGDKLILGGTHDVAMTVLPNAPVDVATGLPVPTIAVATGSGYSIIKDDGTVVDGICSLSNHNKVEKITFTDNNQVAYIGFDFNTQERARFIRVDDLISADTTITSNPDQSQNSNALYGNSGGGITGDVLKLNIPTTNYTGESFIEGKDGNIMFGNVQNLFLINENVGSPSSGMHAGITTNYNTGWMHGDIKGAFLSDTDDTNLSTTDLGLITNADFSNGTTGWSNNATEIFTVSGGVASVDRNGGSAQGQCYQTITTEVGRTYTVGVLVSAVSHGFQVYADNTTIGQGAVNSTGTHYWTFTATSTSTRLDFSAVQNVNGTASFDNITIFDGVADRSVNKKGITVYGTIDRDPVATGAELVAYSGFSGSNYLRQPHNADLNVGTGDFYIMCWAKGNRYFLWHRNDSGSLDMRCEFPISGGSANKPRFYMRNGSATIDFYATTAFDTTTWHHCVWVKRGARNGELYIDGVLNNSGAAGSDLNLNGTNSTFSIGNRADNPTEDFNGYISLFRFGASAPSAEQIKKIYEDEKMLFQENAACTLYGSSDAVTALAYDEVTERLHVGTSSGRSDFQGLRRINNTTTAVTTAISAHDEFIVEQ